MSLSLISCDDIRNHPTNKSTSKQVHVFSKTPRFNKPNPQCPNAFYSYKSELSHRHSSLGYGEKSQIKGSMTAPAPTHYNIATFVELTKNKGKSFGYSRDKLPHNSHIPHEIKNNPSPIHYNNQKNKKDCFSWTCRPKTIDFTQKKLSFKQSPGPGTHLQIDLNPKKGRFLVSNFKDTRLSIINPNGQRFYSYKDGPGPLTYKQGDSLNGQGKYVLSQRFSNGKRTFSKGSRKPLWNTTITPGPGSYKQQSEFGHYGDSNYYKTLRQ